MLLPLIWGYHQTSVRLGRRVTLASVIALQINQSAHAIYIITDIKIVIDYNSIINLKNTKWPP